MILDRFWKCGRKAYQQEPFNRPNLLHNFCKRNATSLHSYLHMPNIAEVLEKVDIVDGAFFEK